MDICSGILTKSTVSEKLLDIGSVKREKSSDFAIDLTKLAEQMSVNIKKEMFFYEIAESMSVTLSEKPNGVPLGFYSLYKKLEKFWYSTEALKAYSR